jgi:hypothetical protein
MDQKYFPNRRSTHNSFSRPFSEGLPDKLNSDPEYADIKEAFIENSLTDWKPTVKMFMYHGKSDVTVPYRIPWIHITN